MFCSLFCQQKTKVEELQSIIRQSAKERLWLERQISNGDSSRSPSPQVLAGDLAADIKKKTERLKMLEDENNNLKSSMTQLQKAEAESLKLVRPRERVTFNENSVLGFFEQCGVLLAFIIYYCLFSSLRRSI